MGLHNGMSCLGFQGICCSVLLHVAVHSLQGLARISPAGHSFWWFSFLMSDVTQSPFLSRKDLPVIFRKWQGFGRGCDGWIIHIWFLLLFSLFGIDYLMTKPKWQAWTRNGLLEVCHLVCHLCHSKGDGEGKEWYQRQADRILSCSSAREFSSVNVCDT